LQNVEGEFLKPLSPKLQWNGVDDYFNEAPFSWPGLGPN